MDRPASARKRVPNFTADEKLLLASLVKKWPIIESKKSDGKIFAKKYIAWQQLTKEFNSHINIHKQRETASLKKAWDNLKTSARRAKAEQRAYIRSTDGPTPSPPPPQQDPLLEIVEAVTTYPDIPDAHIDTDSSHIFDESHLEVQTNDQDQKPSDYVRQEAILRIQHFEHKRKIEIQTLESKLKVEEIRIRAAQLEEERNKILLQKAQLEMEMLKKTMAEL